MNGATRTATLTLAALILELLKCDDCWPQAGGHTGMIVSVKTN